MNQIQPSIMTNTVESSFSLDTRALIGTFHSVSEECLQRHASEFDFSWIYYIKAGYKDRQSTQILLANVGGKRLTYRRPSQ